MSSSSMVFWLGDMNYRIQTSNEMTVEVIKANADNFQISSLLKRDQLVQEMTKGVIFPEFAEGVIDFKPTYKYDPNTDNWDSRLARLDDLRGGPWNNCGLTSLPTVRSTGHQRGVTVCCIMGWGPSSVVTAATPR